MFKRIIGESLAMHYKPGGVFWRANNSDIAFLIDDYEYITICFTIDKIIVNGKAFGISIIDLDLIKKNSV